jgi:hypothetical protein
MCVFLKIADGIVLRRKGRQRERVKYDENDDQAREAQGCGRYAAAGLARKRYLYFFSQIVAHSDLRLSVNFNENCTSII